ncbi:MAG: 2-oxo acid dehydrogenase subunit E2 [Chloroflexi bacterium]|nr:2-oxo acid dehydrogenase subunit E2 [Chloroflexota bacterium]
MAVFELKMPKLGESVTEGTIGKWLKQPGEKVEKYDLLVEVQTDKVNTEIPSEVSGTLKEIKVKEGDTVPVGTLLAVFETAGAEAAAEAKPAQPATAAPASAPVPPRPAPAPAPARSGNGQAAAAAASMTAPAPLAAAARAGPSVDAADIRATPAVRKLASESGIDLALVQGTGLNGRVSRQDVESAIARGTAKPATAPARAAAPAARPAPAMAAPIKGDQPVALTQMRRAIADNMTRAWAAPHAHAVMEIDMTNLMKYRDQVRGDFATREGFDLSPAAFIVKAAVQALRAVPLVNASWSDQGIVLHGDVNVGYAVALGEEGLVVPVIKEADAKSIAELMRSIRDIVDRAKAKKLTFDDFAGGTFTVNNTGPLGTIVSSPIVPPGQAAIISSETIAKRVVVLEDDSIAIRQRMNLVIGFDHRVIDGATAARFLQTIREWLQSVGPSVPVY